MSTIVTRAGKGASLTWIEADANFTNLNVDKLEAGFSSSLVEYLPAGTGAVPITVQSKLHESISVKDFGAVGDGVADDTAAIQLALNNGGVLDLVGGNYLYNHLTISSPITMIGKGTLVYDGLATPVGVASISITAAFSAEELVIECLTSAAECFDIIQADTDNVEIGLLKVLCATQRTQTGGCNFTGSNVFIREVVTENIARPIAFTPIGVATNIRTNIHVGSIVADNYIRGAKFTYASDWSLGYLDVKTRWTGVATNHPGHNGILLEDVSNFRIGDCLIKNSLEHGMRIGGLGVIENFSFGVLTTVDTAGCGVKFNPDPGAVVRSGSVVGIVGINAGEGSSFGNTETVRLTRIDGLQIGYIAGYTFCSKTLTMADVQNLTIGSIYGENVSARLINFDDGQDTSSLNCTNIYISNAVGHMAGTARAAIGMSYSAAGRSISGVYVDALTATGYTNYLASLPSTTISGPVVINANIPATAVAPLFESAPANDLMLCNITYGPLRYSGRANLASFSANETIASSEFNPALTTITAPSERGQRMAASSGAAGIGTYGGSYVFSRVGSTNRRGAAIAAKQITADDKEVNLAFFVQNVTTTANEALIEAMLLKYTGTLSTPLLGTFATNAAAITGGLVTGDMYKTVTGEVRIVV